MRGSVAQDGQRSAAAAMQAAQALQSQLAEVSYCGGLLDFTKPPALDLLRQVFDLERLVALPLPKATDMSWLPEWSNAAALVYKLLLFFGGHFDSVQSTGSGNVSDYEDQCTNALDFVLRLQARQATTMPLFMSQLTPDQRTDARERGLQKARSDAAQIISGALISLEQEEKPAKARVITTAFRETQQVWAKFLLPNGRVDIIDHIAKALKMITD